MWDHFFVLLSPGKSDSLKFLDIWLWEVGAKICLNNTSKWTQRQTDRESNKDMEKSNYRKHWPRGPMLWKLKSSLCYGWFYCICFCCGLWRGRLSFACHCCCHCNHHHHYHQHHHHHLRASLSSAMFRIQGMEQTECKEKKEKICQYISRIWPEVSIPHRSRIQEEGTHRQTHSGLKFRVLINIGRTTH